MSSGGTYENKSVNIKFIYIVSVNILFLFQETPVNKNKNIQVIEASGRGYMVGVLIQLTISGFAWSTAFKYTFCSIYYICFYCKDNLRNGFLMPHFYEKVALFVFLCHLVQKLWKLLTFAIRVWRNPRWPPNEPHGTLVHPVNIDICSLDIHRNL